MKHARQQLNNKKNQKPHTNSLETKTTHHWIWRNTLFTRKRTPAITAIVAGFFIASAATVASQPASRVQTPEASVHREQDFVEEADISATTPITNEFDQQTHYIPPANTNDVHIEAKIQSHTDIDAHKTHETEHSVTVNGRTVDIPNHGTYKQTIEDGSGETTIRIKGSSTGVSLHADIRNKEAE